MVLPAWMIRRIPITAILEVKNLVFWDQMYGLSGRTPKTRVNEVLKQI
jgi:hypothetical protein